LIKTDFFGALKKTRAFSILKSDISNGMGHAYIINCPDEETVKEFFLLAACAAFCERKDECLFCPSCVKVLNNSHADVFTVNEEGKTVKVDEVKRIIESAYIKGLESERKLYFINRADLMTREAQNKLLKTLEEPPLGVSFFLGVSNLAATLETIRSRCRIINIEPFSKEEVFDVVYKITNDKEASNIASLCSNGLLGHAMEIAGSEIYSKVYKKAGQFFTDCKKTSDIAAYLSDKTIVQNAKDFLSILSLMFYDMICYKEGKGRDISDGSLSVIKTASEEYGLKALCESIFKIAEAEMKLSLNLGAQSVIESLLFGILEAKYKWR